MPVVAVCGLGYIGMPMVAAFANSGLGVIGVDIDGAKVKALREKYSAEIFEPGLNETLRKHKSAITFTCDYAVAMKEADAVIITVGTPLKNSREPNYEYIDGVLESIGKGLRRGQVIMLKSTVVPGTTENHAKSRLEALSGLKAGKDFFLAFCPERTIEGMAMHELYTLPKIVGGINRGSAEKAAEIISRLGGRVVIVSSPRVAELCKLIDNLYRAVNIAFANEVGMLCEKMGIDSYEVVEAVNNSYSRTSIFKPGLGADGPCLSKDPEIFRYFSESNALGAALVNATIDGNQHATLRIADIVRRFVRGHKIAKPRIAVLGLAFKGKPETDDMRGAPSVKITDALGAEFDMEYAAFDPVVKTFMGRPVEAGIAAALKGADAVLFLTNHEKLMNADAKLILSNCNKPVLVVDCWHNIADAAALRHARGVEYVRIGDGTA
ncbi:MAG: nucleotide sugar dehydrogenase [Candidatus Diapherotrites archaeon]